MVDDLDFELHVIDSSRKLNYAFTALVFATFALSIEFSPPMGEHLPWLLIISWIFFLVSAISGGYRLVSEDVFYINNLKKIRLQKKLSDPNTSLADKSLAQDEIEKGKEILTKRSRLAICLFRIQACFFLLGIISNLIFVAINYLFKSCVVC